MKTITPTDSDLLKPTFTFTSILRPFLIAAPFIFFLIYVGVSSETIKALQGKITMLQTVNINQDDTSTLTKIPVERGSDSSLGQLKRQLQTLTEKNNKLIGELQNEATAKGADSALINEYNGLHDQYAGLMNRFNVLINDNNNLKKQINNGGNTVSSQVQNLQQQVQDLNNQLSNERSIAQREQTDVSQYQLANSRLQTQLNACLHKSPIVRQPVQPKTGSIPIQ